MLTVTFLQENTGVVLTRELCCHGPGHSVLLCFTTWSISEDVGQEGMPIRFGTATPNVRELQHVYRSPKIRPGRLAMEAAAQGKFEARPGTGFALQVIFT